MDQLEAVRRLIAAWNAEGAGGAARHLHEEAVLVEREDVLERDVIHGRDAVVARWADRTAVVGASKIRIRSLEQIDGARVLADLDVHLRGRVSEVEGDLRMTHLYSLADGLVLRIEEFPDRERAFAELGAATPALGGELAGAWELAEWSALGDGGELRHPLGEDAVGLLVYGSGHMSAHLARADGHTDALSYGGGWERRGDQVVHHVAVATVESFVGAELVRTVSWEGPDLVLTTPPSSGWINRLRWRRAGA